MKRRLIAIALCLGICLGLITAAAAEDGIETLPARTENTGSPYYIMVNRKQNVVTVYELDEENYYSRPVKAMVCSTGRPGHETPKGSFQTTGKYDWLYMVDGTYGQYATRFNKKILFHSICYSRLSPAAMLTEEYNLLGDYASLGCVRLQVGDAKWIYDNCPLKTGVTVYESDDPGPLGKPETLVGHITEELDNRWDPTDPRENNPWKKLLTQEVTLSQTDMLLRVGEKVSLTASRAPENTALPKLVWSVSDPAVAAVDEAGGVTGLGPGQTEVRVICGQAEALCLVTVAVDPLPFSDLKAGAWYYEDVRFAWEKGLLTGDEMGCFLPEESLSEAMVLQILYRLSGGEAAPEPGESWYGPALRWAEGKGLTLEGADPQEPISRQELAWLLWRYETAAQQESEEADCTLTHFSDYDKIDLKNQAALCWAVGAGLIRGTESGALLPSDGLTRVQMAAILHRYLG